MTSAVASLEIRVEKHQQKGNNLATEKHFVPNLNKRILQAAE